MHVNILNFIGTFSIYEQPKCTICKLLYTSYGYDQGYIRVAHISGKRHFIAIVTPMLTLNSDSLWLH